MNKIESNLSPQELDEFNEQLNQTAGPTLEKIQEMAAERGIQISLMSAKNFRDKNFETYRNRIRRAAVLADQIEEFNDADSGKTLADASAALLSQEVFDMIASARFGGEGEIDINTLSKIISRLRTGDQRAKELQMKVDEFERTRAKILAITNKAKSQGDQGISLEKLEELEEMLKIL